VGERPDGEPRGVQPVQDRTQPHLEAGALVAHPEVVADGEDAQGVVVGLGGGGHRRDPIEAHESPSSVRGRDGRVPAVQGTTRPGGAPGATVGSRPSVRYGVSR
jgi:hypothetical protein